MVPLVIRIENTQTQESTTHVFTRSPVHVGRNTLNELTLKDRFVSFWHGILRFDDESIEYVDLGSTNGSEVDGNRVEKNVSVPVNEKTDLRLGMLRLHLTRRADAQTAPARNQTQFGMAAINVSSLMGKPSTPDAPVAVSVSLPVKPNTETIKIGSGFPGAATAHSWPQELAKIVGPKKSAPSPTRLSETLEEAYRRTRTSWRDFYEQLTHALAQLPVETRAQELNTLFWRFPGILQEEQLRSLAKEYGLEVPAPSAAGDMPFLAGGTHGSKPALSVPDVSAAPVQTVDFRQNPGTQLLTLFAQTYSAEQTPLESREQVETFLERAAEVLESFAKAFVELRRGQEQFGTEMGVRTTSEHTPLRRANSGTEVLRYLLDWNVPGAERLQDLKSSFTDIMIHQVAVLNGVREGILALLTRLDPHAPPDALVPARGPPLWMARLWPFSTLNRWRNMVDRYRALTEEESRVQKIVFGPEFARAYAVVAGGQSGTEPVRGTQERHLPSEPLRE